MPQEVPGASPAQPPKPQTGQSAAPQPSANRGYEAGGLQRLGPILQQLQEINRMFPVGSDPWKAVNESLSKLAKFVPPGANNQASQNQMVERMQQTMQQQNPQMQAMQKMRAQMAGGAGGGAAGGAPAGGGMPGMAAGAGA